MSEQRIYSAIHQVMDECGAVAKDSKNPQQGYKYRGIDAVMNAINPALRKARIFVVPEVIDSDREERTNAKGTLLIYSMVKVQYTFFAEDGSFVKSVVIGEGMDSGDKSYNKAMSAAFKYALFQTFCIPTEEMIDSEVDSPEPVARKTEKPKKKSEEPKPSDEDMERVELIAKITNYFLEKGKGSLSALVKFYKVGEPNELTSAMLKDYISKVNANGGNIK